MALEDRGKQKIRSTTPTPATDAADVGVLLVNKGLTDQADITSSALHVYLADQADDIDVNLTNTELPLPTGAATETTLAAIQTAVEGTVDVNLTNTELPLPTGAATETTLAAIQTAVEGTLDVAIVSGLANPLPVTCDDPFIITRDGNSPTAANATYIEPVTGGTKAVVSASNPMAVTMWDGTDTSNPLGSPANPLMVAIDESGVGVGTPSIIQYDTGATKVTKSGGTKVWTIPVADGDTVSLRRITFSAPEAFHWEVVFDTTTLLGKFYTGTDSNPYTHAYDIPPELSKAGGANLVITATNDGNNDAHAALLVEKVTVTA